MSDEKEVRRDSCPNCDAADAVCAAYRHALKDIARGKPDAAARIAILALDNDRVRFLGQLFHKIVKAATVLYRHRTDPLSVDYEKAMRTLEDAVEAILKNPGATVKGWTGDI
jgi:hypothetical protein